MVCMARGMPVLMLREKGGLRGKKDRRRGKGETGEEW